MVRLRDHLHYRSTAISVLNTCVNTEYTGGVLVAVGAAAAAAVAVVVVFMFSSALVEGLVKLISTK